MLRISEQALNNLKERIASEGVWGVRVSIVPAGCTGYEYKLQFEECPSATDTVYNKCIAVDSLTLSTTPDINIEWVEKDLQKYFLINTPSEINRCGCGESFAL